MSCSHLVLYRPSPRSPTHESYQRAYAIRMGDACTLDQLAMAWLAHPNKIKSGPFLTLNIQAVNPWTLTQQMQHGYSNAMLSLTAQVLSLHRALRQDITAAKRELTDLSAWHRHTHAGEVRAVARATADEAARLVMAERRRVDLATTSDTLAQRATAEMARADHMATEARDVAARKAELEAEYAAEVGQLRKRCRLLATQVCPPPRSFQNGMI
jgi:hypothetical protein